jgi:hypothetical protein
MPGDKAEGAFGLLPFVVPQIATDAKQQLRRVSLVYGDAEEQIGDLRGAVFDEVSRQEATAGEAEPMRIRLTNATLWAEHPVALSSAEALRRKGHVDRTRAGLDGHSLGWTGAEISLPL